MAQQNTRNLFKMCTGKSKENLNLTEAVSQFSNENATKREETSIQIIKYIETTCMNEQQVKTSLQQLIKRLGGKCLQKNAQNYRSGISATLTQLLQQHDKLSVDDALKCEDESLIIHDPTSKHERNIVLGKVLLHTTLIKSGKIRKAATENIAKVTQSLLECRKWQTSLNLICFTALKHLIMKISKDQFSDAVFPILKPQLTSGWKKCDPYTLFLLIVARRSHPELIKGDILLNHWDCKKILHLGNSDHLKRIIGLVERSQAMQHPLFQEIANLALKKSEESYAEFWKVIVLDPVLLYKRKYIVLAMSYWGLKTTTCESQMEAIMNEKFVDILLQNAVVNDSPCNKEAMFIVKELPDLMKTYCDTDIQLAAVKAIMRSPHGLHFSQSRMCENILMKLSGESGEALSTYLQLVLEGHQTLVPSKPISEEDQRHLVGILCTLTQQQYAAAQIDSVIRILQWLFLCTNGKVLKTNKCILHCNRIAKEHYSLSVKEKAGSALTKSLNRLATFNPGMSVKIHHMQYIDILYQLSQYVQVLVTSPETVEFSKHFKEKMLASWSSVVEIVDKIRSKHIKGSDIGQGHGFELLFLHMGLQLFQPKATDDVIKDLHVCCGKAFQNKRKSIVKEAEGPSWVEVVVEVLLSILSRHSSMDRAVVNTVFTILCPHITSQAMKLLFDALQPPTDNGPLNFKDSDEEESEDEESEEEEVTVNGGDDDDDSSGDENEEQEAVDAQFRNSVKKALGNAADDDTNSESDDDLDDEAMFKLDKALAAAFEARSSNTKKAKQEREKQIIDYKQRVLTLLDIYARNDSHPSVILELLCPILEFIGSASKDNKQKPLAKRAAKILNHYYNNKHVATDPQLQKNQLLKTVKSLLQMSKKGAERVKDVANAVLYVVKIAMSLEKMTVPSPIKTRSRSAKTTEAANPGKKMNILEEIVSVIKQTVMDFCERRDQQLSHLLFHTILEKQPILFWDLSEGLLQCISDEKNLKVYQRTQVCSMLATMINNATPSSIGSDLWLKFFTKLQQLVSAAIIKMSTGEIKVKYAGELLLVLYKAVRVSPQKPESLPADFEETLRKLKSQGNKDVSKLCFKMIGVLLRGQRSKRKREDESEDRKDTPEKKKKKKTKQESKKGENHSKTPEKPTQSTVKVTNTETQGDSLGENNKKKNKHNRNEVLKTTEETVKKRKKSRSISE